MKIKNIFLAVFLISFFNVSVLKAEQLSVEQIVDKANKVAYYEGNDGMAEVNMIITDSQGRKRIREFTILRKDVQDGGEQKFYIYFYKPEDVRDMVYMVWKHLGKDDDRWLYLPALDLVRRIAASDRRSSFVGSHFVYEDVSGRGIDEDTHELVGEEDGYYKIKNIPKNKKYVEFEYYYIWIRKDNFMPIKTEYYDSRGKKYRAIEALKVEDIQGYPTITEMKAEDLNSNGNTVITYNKIQYDIGLTDDIFTERYLRRPPTKWIKRK
jgi:outer membrane lipoprotein-sorting protein